MLNLADAEAVLGNPALVQSEVMVALSQVNYSDFDPNTGHFGGDLPFPVAVFVNANDPDNEHFAVQVFASIEIPTAGFWTFGTNNDDGMRLRIDGLDLIDDDFLHGVTDFFGTRNLSAGTHSLDLVFFEAAGRAAIELFAAKGEYDQFSDTDTWRLFGDVTDRIIPEPTTFMMWLVLGLIGATCCHRRRP